MTPLIRDANAAGPVPRLLAWVVLTLMVVASAYTIWIVLANFHRIGV